MFYRQEIPSLCLCCTQVLWPCSQVFSWHNITDRDAQSLSGLVCYYNRHTYTHSPSWLAQFIWPQSDSWRCISYHWQWPLFHTDNYSVVVVRVCLDSEGLNEISKRPKQSSRNIFVYFQKCMYARGTLCRRKKSIILWKKLYSSLIKLWQSCAIGDFWTTVSISLFLRGFHLQPFPLFSIFPTPQVWTKYSPMACQSTIGGKYMRVNSLMKHIQ